MDINAGRIESGNKIEFDTYFQSLDCQHKKSIWKGYDRYDFVVAGREAILIKPHTIAAGRPWVWRAEFFDAFSQADMALLEKGWFLAYVKVSDMYGCPEAIELMHTFYQFIVENMNLKKRTVLFGFSRGGLYAFNYAAKYPEEVHALYLDAPVLDIRSWPGGIGTGDGAAKEWQECLEAYHINEESLNVFNGNPLDNIMPVVKAGIPIIAVVGDADTVVPYSENTRILEQLYQEAGGNIQVIHKHDIGHHPHSLDDPTPIVNFIIENCTLNNTLYLLKNKKALTIGYFGGSITEGAGATDEEKTSWRALTTAWFKEEYPDCDIKEIQAAIGGTGSDLGIYRCDNDLISKNPDLVFVEFAVNDYGRNQKRFSSSVEGIVRRIWNSNPYADVVFVFTITKKMAYALEQGEQLGSVEVHKKIAGYYKIPMVNVGEALMGEIEKNKGTWETYTTDTVHPTDAGYAVYAEKVREFLKESLVMGDELYSKIIREPLNDYVLENSYLVDAWDIEQNGWERLEQSMANRYPHMLGSNIPDSTISFKFKGSSIGVYWLIAPDSGDIEWSVDGSMPQRASSWDKYALQFTRANYCILADDLPDGEHLLTIKVLGEKQEESQGDWIRIGAFMVGEV